MYGTRLLLVIGLVLLAWQGWVHFTADAPAPLRAPVSAEALARIQVTLGQAALALRAFGAEGLLSDRFDFEANLSRVRQSLESLERTASEADERHALDRAKALLERLTQLEREHIARVEGGGGPMGPQTLAAIPRLRDEIAGALDDFREVGVRRASAVAESPSLTALLRGAVVTGVGLLFLCIGGIAVWSRLFST